VSGIVTDVIATDAAVPAQLWDLLSILARPKGNFESSPNTPQPMHCWASSVMASNESNSESQLENQHHNPNTT